MKIDSQISKAVNEVLRDNTHRMNRIRTVGTGIFVLIGAPIAFFIEPKQANGDHTWLIIFCGATAYFLISLIILFASQAHSAMRRLSSFAIPFLDIPVVIGLQAIVITNAQINKGHASIFTTSLLVCFILLSTFTLDLRKLGVTVAIAAIGGSYLHYLAGVDLATYFCSLAIFGVVTWVCIFAKKSRIDLVTRVTKANIRRIRLQRYFSPGVGELIEKHDEEVMALGQECDLTILFTDIRGFTRMSENIPGPEIVAFLNKYHSRMVEAVFKHGGTLDKYLGDGLMVYFNAPVQQKDHAQRAVQCALQMQREIAALNAERSWHGQEDLRIGIGIHSGRAILGDIGAPHRREFTAIGDTVNVAAELEELTKDFDHDVIVSRATADLVDDDFCWTKLGHAVIRNRDEKLRFSLHVEQERN